MEEQQEAAVIIIWDWNSVQIPILKISSFITKTRAAVVEHLEANPRECGFIIFCDARITPVAVTREFEKSIDLQPLTDQC